MATRPPERDRPADIYDPAFVRRLFDDMARTYDRVNTITSFGFSTRWRSRCVDDLHLEPGQLVHDWMTGMGEAWPAIDRRIGASGSIVAVDLSSGMLAFARRRHGRMPGRSIEIVEGDVLENAFPDGSADAVACLFGLKTLSADLADLLAREIARVLRPGGRFSVVEVSVPQNRALRALYMFYLKRVIPVLGAILLGDPETYRMLGRYTERFGNAGSFASRLRAAGLEVEVRSWFFGCATGATGSRPVGSPG
jgi:ubiquinone/menaquinone biosynthesis methyltransferase